MQTRKHPVESDRLPGIRTGEGDRSVVGADRAVATKVCQCRRMHMHVDHRCGRSRALDLLRSLPGSELDPAIFPAFEQLVQRATEERTVLQLSDVLTPA